MNWTLGTASSTRSETILFVCTANLARSPLAAVMLQRELDAFTRTDIGVRSAGTHVPCDALVPGPVLRVADEYELDLSRHRPQQVDRDLAMSADLVLTMTEAQRSALLQLAPDAVARVFTLLELRRLLTPVAASVHVVAPSLLARAAHRQRPTTPQAMVPEDIEDPMGRSVRRTRRIAADIMEVVHMVAQGLGRQAVPTTRLTSTAHPEEHAW